MIRPSAFDIIHPSVVSAVKGGTRKSSPSLQRAVASIELALNHGHHINTRLSRALYLDKPAQHAIDTRAHERRSSATTLLENRTLKLWPLVDDQTTVLLAAVEATTVHFRVLAALQCFQGSMGAFGAPKDRDATMHWDIVSEQVGIDVRPFDSPLTQRRLERIGSLVRELRVELQQLAAEAELKALVVAGSRVLCHDHQNAWDKAREDVADTPDVTHRRATNLSPYQTLLSLNSPGATDQGTSVAVDDGSLKEPERFSLGFFPNRDVSVVYERKTQDGIIRAQQRIS